VIRTEWWSNSALDLLWRKTRELSQPSLDLIKCGLQRITNGLMEDLTVPLITLMVLINRHGAVTHFAVHLLSIPITSHPTSKIQHPRIPVCRLLTYANQTGGLSAALQARYPPHIPLVVPRYAPAGDTRMRPRDGFTCLTNTRWPGPRVSGPGQRTPASM